MISPYPIEDVSSTRIRRERKKRVVVIGETRVCSEEFGVTSLTTKHSETHAHRRVPCEQCPFRMDVPTGVFPAEAFRTSAHTADDGAFETFACHMSGFAGLTCAGFLHRHDLHNIGVRFSRSLGRLGDEEIGDGGFPIYPTYREMAIANGVDEDDPCLANIRGNNEEAAFFRTRKRSKLK